MNFIKSRPWLLLSLIFLIGAVTGSALTTLARPHFMHPPGPDQMRNHLLMRLTHRLNLTDDQQAKIKPILFEAGTQMEAVHHDEVGRIGQILAASNQKISLILTPEQQAELQKMQSEDLKRFSDRKRAWGGPGPHGPPPDGEPPPPPGNP